MIYLSKKSRNVAKQMIVIKTQYAPTQDQENINVLARKVIQAMARVAKVCYGQQIATSWCIYSRTPLIRPPFGQNILVVLTRCMVVLTGSLDKKNTFNFVLFGK